MASRKHRFRKIHRTVAPIMILPILLTLLTGSAYQVTELLGKDDDFRWLLALHKGHFGALNLESFYVFLNALGLLTMAITGITMWLHMQRNSNRIEKA